MKQLTIFVLVALCIGSFLGGCNVDGMVYPQAERERRIEICNDLWGRQLVDDCDYVVFYDRPSYLSEWPIRDTD